jgi:RNA polymerase sigma factor (sigma-70 family)
MRHWLRLLARRLTPRRRARCSCPSARRDATLQVESLEHRTLMAVLPVTPPALPAAPPAVVAREFAAATPDDQIALNRLLADLQQLDAPPLAPPVSLLQTAGISGLSLGAGTSSTPSTSADALSRILPAAPPAPSAPPPAALQTAPQAAAPGVTLPDVVQTSAIDAQSAGTVAFHGTAAPPPTSSTRPAAPMTDSVDVPVPYVSSGPSGGSFGTAGAQMLRPPDGSYAVALTNAVPPPATHSTSAAPVVQPFDAPADPRPADLDGMLLQRFVSARDQGAFDGLVRRHEQLVQNICRRVLSDAHLAEDALQATFLILARKAATLDPARPLAGWLYMVAYHLSLRLRAVAARRRRSDLHAARRRPTEIADLASAELETREVHHVLREELQQLPDQYRVPLSLCYFDGQTHAEAAETIGMPRGSMAKRIGEGLALLRERLLERGITF